MENTLIQSHHTTSLFLNQMAALSKVIATLTLSQSFDDLCYRAVDLGRRELGFDRLGLWFTTDEANMVVGSYGTDETGQIRDERPLRMPLRADDHIGQQLRLGARYVVMDNGNLVDLYGNPLQSGWSAAAALWDGTRIIGYLFTDNLLTLQAYTESTGELLALYALLLGHLCTRQRMEEALREREASYRSLVDALPDHLFVVTRTGLIVDYHQAKPDSLRLPFADMVGKHVHETLSSQAAAEYMNAIEEAYLTGNLITFEYTFTYERQAYHLEVRMSAGQHDKVVVLVRDITNRKRLEEQLFAAQKMESLGRMAGGIAHDFNNLLTVIRGFTNLAAAVPNSDPRLASALERIGLASEKGARLTNQLLLFARKQVVHRQILNANEQILSLVPILEPLLGETITLTINAAATASHVQFDPGQFEQIIVNLAVNARDAMERGGCLSITTNNLTITEQEKRLHQILPLGPYLLIQVADTGIGISEQMQKQIFEPFFTTKPAGKGTGLGLAICYSIVQQNKGHITVQSIVGIGTQFSIYLPVTAPAPIATMAPVPQPKLAGHETILLVEDDEPVRAITTEALTSYGYRVLAYGSGKEALRMAGQRQTTIALLVSDMTMPHMNGKEVAEQFRQIYADAPILLVSGYADEWPESLASQPNVSFLSKPYTIQTLATAVRAAIDQA